MTHGEINELMPVPRQTPDSIVSGATPSTAATDTAAEVLAAVPRLSPEQILDLLKGIDLNQVDREVRMALCAAGRRAWSTVNEPAN
jgi:hypothetical protein